jgi:hypothetical protein
MTLSEYIKVLQALEPDHGDTHVCMTQGGYYADGKFADLYDMPEIETIEFYYEEIIDGDWWKRKRIPYKQEYLVLGHSSQNY